jgi:hypothetical protein
MAVAGCGGKTIKRSPVAGTIKFAGKEIKYGSVRFEPAEGQTTTASGDIRDGKFAIDRAAGLSPGKYKVFVQAFDRIAEPKPGSAPGSEGPPPKDILPAKYQASPAGEATIKETSGSESNTFDLDIPK